MVTPLTVTPAWLDAWFRASSRCSDRASWLEEALRAAPTAGKDFARLRLRDVTLTIPVEGGSNALKRHNACPRISEHGKWRREHLGALDAVYRRTPFYAHLMPEFERIYSESEGKTLEEFNNDMLLLALRWLDVGDGALRSETQSESTGRTLLFTTIRHELTSKINPGISIFDAIFRLGKETGLAFFNVPHA